MSKDGFFAIVVVLVLDKLLPVLCELCQRRVPLDDNVLVTRKPVRLYGSRVRIRFALIYLVGVAVPGLATTLRICPVQQCPEERPIE